METTRMLSREPSSPMPDTITGTTIADRYQITGYLRTGRMGDIYVARRLEDGHRVNVKLLDPALFYNEEAVKRFARETLVTRTIDHPASMRVLDFGRGRSGPYLVLEYVEGEFLSDVIAEQGALDPLRAARIAARIATALEAAHAVGVVHRDLAPANVLLARQGDERDIVKVTDFGLAMLTQQDPDDGNEELTAVGVRIGTPDYMAPEYIIEYELDTRADIYGLGVMLFEMITGELPFVGRPYKVMDQHVNAPIPHPAQRRPGVPDWLDALVVQMMSKLPEERVQSAAEVIALIEQGLGEQLSPPTYVAPTEPPPEPRRPASEPVIALEPLIRGHLHSLSRAPGAIPDPAQLFVVEQVAATSVAATIGVAPGWRVELPPLPPPGVEASDFGERRRYVFFPPDGEVPLAAETSGIDLGMRLLRAPRNVMSTFDPLHPEPSALLDLWRQARWAELERLALGVLACQPGPVEALVDPGELARFLSSDAPRNLHPPTLLLLGAAQHEQGRRAEGLRWVHGFHDHHAAAWPAIYSGIAHLYLGLELLEQGHPDQAPELLARAFHLGRLPRAAARYQELVGRPLEQAPWLGRRFGDYTLPEASGPGAVRLSAVCEAMNEAQLTIVCVMGGQRGSLDYDRFMQRYLRLARSFRVFLFQLHVVTSSLERDPDHPEHYQGEDALLATDLPVRLLHDQQSSVHRTLVPDTLPMIYAIDHRRICVHQGLLSACDLWDSLANAGRLQLRP